MLAGHSEAAVATATAASIAMAAVITLVAAMATTMATAMGAAIDLKPLPHVDVPPRPPAPEFNVEVIWRHAVGLQTPSASLGAQQTPQQEQHHQHCFWGCGGSVNACAQPIPFFGHPCPY